MASDDLTALVARVRANGNVCNSCRDALALCDAITGLRAELAERTRELEQSRLQFTNLAATDTAAIASEIGRADAAEAKLADVLRRVREFVSKILAEPTVERQVRAMIPEAFTPDGGSDAETR